jgi:hypothetical protein
MIFMMSRVGDYPQTVARWACGSTTPSAASTFSSRAVGGAR